MATCTHLDTVTVTQLPESVDGCEDCLATGGLWLHLRICLQCGHVGCCDDSPNRHASAHARATSHPLIRSLEPGEDWSWCFVDQVALRIPAVQGTKQMSTLKRSRVDRRSCSAPQLLQRTSAWW
jgi:uncharacterized UBP type Zn finger protein